MDIGEFASAELAPPVFTVELQLQAQDLQDHWRRCNMLANYLAEYTAYQFAEREWAENLISTVANEFLEAVAALSPPDAAIDMRCAQHADELLLEIEHRLRPELTEAYLDLLRALARAETDELYFELLTAAHRPAQAFNQFGLVMLVHDFHTRIAAQLTEPAGRIRIQLYIPTKEIAA
jgi:hypothetical protein